MRSWFSAAVIACLALGACPSNSADKNTDPAALTANAYLGVCDGSAAIAMPDGKGFMVAADDSNVLLAYMNATTPALSRDVGVELGLKVKKKRGTTGEIDIEGAAGQVPKVQRALQHLQQFRRRGRGRGAGGDRSDVWRHGSPHRRPRSSSADKRPGPAESRRATCIGAHGIA